MASQITEQGRSTPPPHSREDITNLNYDQLLQRHEELQAKYSKVKRYYFEREAQVTQLQNTVATQRLSMSKTSLDDAQYTARFERLNQSINNTAYNIRQNWRAIPPWLGHVCNRDAHTTGKKEMTAIGRACIARWLYETVFERTFHPALHPELSAQLKIIERSIRRSGQATSGALTDDQRDDLITKLTTWRLTTIEGLQEQLSSRIAEQTRETLIQQHSDHLTDSLKANLTDPPPPGLREGVHTLVSQAIDIAANLPLESRDICIEYFMPGAPVNDTYMKLEAGMTALSDPGQDERVLARLQAQQQLTGEQEGDHGSMTSTEHGEKDVESEIRDSAAKASSAGQGHQGRGSVQQSTSSSTLRSQNDKKKTSSFLGGFVTKKPAPQSRLNPSSDNISNVDSDRQNPRESVQLDPSSVATSGNKEGTIRFAAFFSIEVRGKSMRDRDSASGESTGSRSAANVLFKAPVYEYTSADK